MKIVISVDIEGASGVVTSREMGYPIKPIGDPQSCPDYARACNWLTEDINAAVEGALEAGATEFVVHDSHGHGYTNILIDSLHPSVEVVSGMPIIFYEYEDLERNKYDAAFMIGMHARAGEAGILSHILSWPDIMEVRINGIPVGESHITAGLAEYFGCPTILITGDDIVCDEFKKWTNGQVETAAVKKSYSRYAARCLPLKESRKLIHDAAYRAVKRIGEFKPVAFKKPVRLEVDFCDRQIAKYISWMPNIDYNGNCTVAYTDEDFFKVSKVLNAMFFMGHL